MEFKTTELIAELIEKTRININKVENYRDLSKNALNHKESLEKWSVLECLEHLNLYGDFYNPEIKRSIETSQTKPDKTFKSGLIGNYFVNTMLPKKKLNKMKTFKDKNPSGSSLDTRVIDRFIRQQKEFLELLQNSRNINVTKTTTAISISKLVKMRLGDTFRFIVAHNERHLIQADNALKQAIC
ncbi:MAG: hypothetical protein COA58_15860 [Bacteroidetes bacterium]|nr:MAG: hypothetical protein COA58_15860 [Bacteroidota bacterium]